MTDKITIEILAPPPQNETAWEFMSWAKEVHRIATQKQEPRELVRFWHGGGSSWWACDDLGNVYTFAQGDDFKPIIRDWSIEEAVDLSFDELHPRLTIRRKDPDVEGEWVCELHPFNGELPPLPCVFLCDQNGNPLPKETPPSKAGSSAATTGWLRLSGELAAHGSTEPTCKAAGFCRHAMVKCVALALSIWITWRKR